MIVIVASASQCKKPALHIDSRGWRSTPPYWKKFWWCSSVLSLTALQAEMILQNDHWWWCGVLPLHALLLYFWICDHGWDLGSPFWSGNETTPHHLHWSSLARSSRPARLPINGLKSAIKISFLKVYKHWNRDGKRVLLSKEIIWKIRKWFSRESLLYVFFSLLIERPS